MRKLHTSFPHYNVWEFYFYNICFLGYKITSECWLIYWCQGYFDRLSKVAVKRKDFFYWQLLNILSFDAQLTQWDAAVRGGPQPTKEKCVKCAVCPFPCALREERCSSLNCTSELPPHNGMIGRADIFLGTANYTITNQKKKKH